VQASVSRGKIEVTISSEAGADAPLTLELNEPLAEQYHAILERLRDKFDMKKPLRMESFVALPDVVFWKEPEADLDLIWAAATEALERCLEDFNAMRETEGQALAKDLHGRLGHIGQEVEVRGRRGGGQIGRPREGEGAAGGAGADPWR
jgi:uncharacterized protein (TIGR00255 family)